MKILASILVAVAFVALNPAAQAQRSAGSKITGSAYEYPYFYQSAGAYQDSAYRHADVLRESTSYGEPVPREIAQEHTAAIRQNIAAANKKYAAMRKMAGDNKEVAKSLDAIEAYHKQALAHCDKIDEHCASGKGDAAKVNDASHATAQSLKRAQAEHEKLMQYFGKPTVKTSGGK